MAERSLHKAMVVGSTPTPGTVKQQPIGIIDSGVGGLTIWQEIARQLPHESVIYVADSKNCPYGEKTPEQIYSLAKKLVEFLVAKDVKLVVVACNTITVTCLERLRNDFPHFPMIGTVPVVKTAVDRSSSHKIGILSTITTANSVYQKNLIQKFASGLEVINIGTDKLVPLVEAGKIRGTEAHMVLNEVLFPFKNGSVDVLALGCTHFPFLRAEMQEILGQNVQILDSRGAIARQVERILERNEYLTVEGEGSHMIYTTGEKQVLEALLQGINMHHKDIRIEKNTL